jgi:DNA modification methylase
LSATGSQTPLRVRVVPSLQLFCYPFPVTLGFQRVSASRWTSQRVVGELLSGNAGRFLAEIAAELRREIGAINRMDSALVERDIASRRREAALGRRWANMRTRIQKELERLGGSEAEWCKRELDCDIATMRRRVQLAKGWRQYEIARREAGNNGQYGLVYGLSLIRTETIDIETRAHQLRVRSRIGTDRLDTSRCQFITGDALAELRKMRSRTVSVVVCSPPYWPVKRWYGGEGIGFEATLTEYVASLVAIFREARRVLKDDGVLWIVVADSYATRGGKWKADSYQADRPNHKERMPDGTHYPATGRSPGDLLMIPARLAMALQDDSWILRHEIIWNKVWSRPESAKDRVTRTHEMIYMFAKRKRYFYDADPTRDPLASSAGQQPGLRGCDTRRDFRIYNNPLGRNAGSVWQIHRGSYVGRHAATFPPELARRMIASSCDDNSVVLDVFGGAGTTAMVALQLGHRTITIDINADYTREARQRLSNAPSLFATETAGQKEGVAGRRTYSTATNASAKPDGGNVIDLIDAKVLKRMRH